MYDCFSKIQKSYAMLQDDESKEVFAARLLYDMEPSQENLKKLCLTRFLNKSAFSDVAPWGALRFSAESIRRLTERGEKAVIYGLGNWGRSLALRCIEINGDFYGFVSRGAERFPNGLLGKPVFPPEWLLDHAQEVYVIPAVSNKFGSYDAIRKFLSENRFPEERILKTMLSINQGTKFRGDMDIYFEFSDLYKPGTAFVDAGCCDGETSVLFTRFCGNSYSRIYAFEPNPNLFKECEKTYRERKMRDVLLLQAGLSDTDGTAIFTPAYEGSHIVSEKSRAESADYEIRTVALDNVVKDDAVGFIKMDIEGSEFDALHGAARTIQRDKPMLAICLYHKPGDMLAIMDYVRELASDYRFWLRHYNFEMPLDTILYAAI